MTVKPSFSDRFSDFYVRHEYAVVLFFISVWQAVLFIVSDNRLIEPDNYTHAMRLSDFIQSGSWREILYRHDNCPYGQMLHFTRFTDMFLYVATMPFLPFMELKKAILYGCFLYNPLIACLSAAALIWAEKPFFSPLMRAFSQTLFFTGSASFMFLAGRPDHHVLLNLLLILLTGCLLYGAKTQKTAYFKTAGVIAGLSVWATPEGFLACLLLLSGMVSAWFIRCQNIRQIRFFSQFFFLSTAACLIANPPMQGFFHPDNGRLSILMVVILGLAFLSFYAEEALKRKKYVRSFAGRFTSLFLLTSASLGMAVLIFGTKALFSSPIPEELFDIWTSKVQELQPTSTENFLNSSASILIDSCIIGIIALFLADARTKKILLTLCPPLIFFTVLTMMYMRFSRTEIVFATFVLPVSVRFFLKDVSFSRKTRLILTTLCALFLISAFIAGRIPSYHLQMERGKEQNVKNILPYLTESNGCILSTVNLGSELAWLTDRAVIGTPYHSNDQGIIDNHTLLTGNLNRITSLLKKRRISTVIVDAQSVRSGNGKSFIEQLYSGKANACFVRPVSGLPTELKENFLVFNVDFTACDRQEK